MPAPDRRPHRQRPAPTSALAPAPTPLMPVPGPGSVDYTSAGDRKPRVDVRAGRRQHHRPAGSTTDELVYLSGRIPRPLRDELHIRAIHEGRPVVELLRDAIRGYLDHPDAPPTR